MQTTLRECEELSSIECDNEKRKGEHETTNTINTIAVGSELITNGENKNGFFSENVKSIMKNKQSIEKAIEKISS